MRSKISAESAQYDTVSGVWHLRNWTRRDYTEGMRDQIKTGRQLDTVLSLTRDDFFLNKFTIQRLNKRELNQLIPVLAGNTAVMYSESPNAPAKLIKKLQKDLAGKPELKGAYVQECAFVGADKLDELCAIKSKEELIGDIISLLQSPMRNVISALQNGGGQTIAGLVKTLSEKEEK